jgi:hypothetical protein
MAVIDALTSSNDNSGDIVDGDLLIKALSKLLSGTLRTYSLRGDPAVAGGGAKDSMRGGKDGVAPASGDKTGSSSEVDQEEDEEEDAEENEASRAKTGPRRRGSWQRRRQCAATPLGRCHEAAEEEGEAFGLEYTCAICDLLPGRAFDTCMSGSSVW